jgi:hypothetical protein
VPERTNGTASKAVRGLNRPSRVRITPPPPKLRLPAVRGRGDLRAVRDAVLHRTRENDHPRRPIRSHVDRFGPSACACPPRTRIERWSTRQRAPSTSEASRCSSPHHVQSRVSTSTSLRQRWHRTKRRRSGGRGLSIRPAIASREREVRLMNRRLPHEAATEVGSADASSLGRRCRALGRSAPWVPA